MDPRPSTPSTSADHVQVGVGEGQLQAASAVLGSRSHFVDSGIVLDVSRGGWRAVFDLVLIGAAVLTTWTLARSRRAAAAGLTTAVMLALLGTVAFEPALIFFRASVGWAVLLALGVRIALPDTRWAADGVRERAAN
jgi:hypothetical protein